MYRNQYLATSSEKIMSTQGLEFESLSIRRFCGLNVFYHPDLQVHESHDGMHSVLLFGYVFDPEHPGASNQMLADSLAKACAHRDGLFARLEFLTGRFVVFVGETGDDFAPRLIKIASDACALKQVYYGQDCDGFYATSSLKMFYDLTGKTVEVRRDKYDFMNSLQYQLNERAWYCDEEFDDTLKKLLPNHHYDHGLGRAVRTPWFNVGDVATPEQTYELCTAMLRGAYTALVGRYRPLQALTAGLDSRTLLAASRGCADDIHYYMFDFGGDEVAEEIRVARRIAHEQNLRFSVFPVSELTEEFKEVYAAEHVFPDFAEYTLGGIQYHYQAGIDNGLINVNGNCGEILRCVFGHSRRPVPRRNIYYYTRYRTRFPFLSEAVEHWYDNALAVAEEISVSITDLFYWELKMGTWGATYPFKQDIAIDEYSPFNNKRLLLTFMRLPASIRRRPASTASRAWIEQMWPGLMTHPVNPSRVMGKRWIRNVIGSNPHLVYYFNRYRHLVT